MRMPPEDRMYNRIIRVMQLSPGKEFTVDDVVEALGSKNHKPSVNTALGKLRQDRILKWLRKGVYTYPLPEGQQPTLHVVAEPEPMDTHAPEESPSRIALPPTGTVSRRVHEISQQVTEMETRVVEAEELVLQLQAQLEERDQEIAKLRQQIAGIYEVAKNDIMDYVQRFTKQDAERGEEQVTRPFDQRKQNSLAN